MPVVEDEEDEVTIDWDWVEPKRTRANPVPATAMIATMMTATASRPVPWRVWRIIRLFVVMWPDPANTPSDRQFLLKKLRYAFSKMK
jgi:hypothetical protein